jgi:hypothetical protein
MAKVLIQFMGQRLRSAMLPGKVTVLGLRMEKQDGIQTPEPKPRVWRKW